MRYMTYAEALERVAEVTKDNRDELRKSRLQRRTEFTDLYGIPFYAESDEDNEARFYVSVSPDLVYFMRFQFKIYVQHLAASDDGDFEIRMNGVDITPYLIEQSDGEWIDGEGLYPSNAVEDETDFYDLLDVATVLYNEGNTEDAEKLLKPGFKTMVIKASSSFKVTMYLYAKYTTSAR